MDKSLRGIQIAAYILLAVSAVLCVMGLFVNVDLGWKISAGIDFVAVLMALFYFSKGCKKDSSKYFKIVMTVMAVEYLLSYVEGAFVPGFVIVESWYDALISLIVYGNIVLLAFGKDLGKTASVAIAGFNVAAYVYCLITSIGNPLSSKPMVVAWVLMSVSYLLMVIAKYKDKESRNTK